MAILFSEVIDAKCREISKRLQGTPINVNDTDFIRGYCAFLDDHPQEACSLAMPENSPLRLLSSHDNVDMIPILLETFKAILGLGDLLREKKISFGIVLDDYAVMMSDFKCDQDACAFYSAAICVTQVAKFDQVYSLVTPMKIPLDLEKFYNQRDRLLNVSSGYMNSSAVVFKEFGLAVTACVEHDLWGKLSEGINNPNFQTFIRPASFVPFDKLSRFAPAMEAKIWGMPFTEDMLRSLSGKQYGEYAYTFENGEHRESMLPLLKLQYSIESRDNGTVASGIIEEVIDIYYGQSIRGVENYKYGTESRYFVKNRMVHFLYDKMAATCIHLDMSELYYDQDAYQVRRGQTLGKVKPKATIKSKVYRVDGRIPFALALSLIGLSLDAGHNPEVSRLLLGQ